MPSVDVDMEDIPDLTPVSNEDEDNDELYVGEDALEDRDHIFIATIPCEAVHLSHIEHFATLS
jgi:hypothetical protein